MPDTDPGGALDRARDSFTLAVRKLVGPDRIQDRLVAAYEWIHVVRPQELPKREMRRCRAEIEMRLTKVRTGNLALGYLRNTLDVMDDKEAGQIAELIISLHEALITYNDADEEPDPPHPDDLVPPKRDHPTRY